MSINSFSFTIFYRFIPLGSPKYIPPVSSLTIIISKPETISGFKLDASTNCLKQIAGLRFANNFNSFLNFKSALSGLFENSKLSHLDHQLLLKLQLLTLKLYKKLHL